MNIACTSCPAKYGVPDEKVRGRKVRITCKRCGAAIIVDGTQAGALEGAAPVVAEAPAERTRQRTILGGLEAPTDSAPGAPRSQPPPADAAAPAPAAIAPKAAAVPKPAGGGIPKPGGAFPAAKAEAKPKVEAKPAAKAPETTWTVAVTDEDHRDMPTTQVVEAYAAGTIDGDTFIWKDGMEDWLTPFEIPEIATALGARGISRPGEGPTSASGGAWHEPGKWDQEAAPSGDPYVRGRHRGDGGTEGRRAARSRRAEEVRRGR